MKLIKFNNKHKKIKNKIMIINNKYKNWKRN